MTEYEKLINLLEENKTDEILFKKLINFVIGYTSFKNKKSL